MEKPTDLFDISKKAGNDGFFYKFGDQPFCEDRSQRIYLYGEPYSDKTFAARLVRVDRIMLCQLSLIPGLPNDDGYIPIPIISLNYTDLNEPGSVDFKVTAYMFERETPIWIEYSSIEYDSNGFGKIQRGTSRPKRFGVYNYDIRNFPRDLYNPSSVPQRIDVLKTVRGFTANIRHGDFSQPHLFPA